MKGAGWLPRPVTVVGRLRQRFHRGDFLLPFQTVRQTITGSAWKGPRMGTIYLWTILAYLLGLVVVGLKGSRGVASQEDFSVAGRRLSTFVLFGTLLATWIGTGSIFGNAEKTYRVGVAAAILPVASLLGIAVLYFLAGRVRGLERSSYYYAPRPRNDQGLRGALRKSALRHRRWGYQTLTELLIREGWRDIHDR